MTLFRTAVLVLLGAAGMSVAWGQESPRKPTYDQPRLEDAADVLPPVATPSPQQSLAGSASVFVREIVLIDGSVFSPEDLDPILAPFLGRRLTNEQLRCRLAGPAGDRRPHPLPASERALE